MQASNEEFIKRAFEAGLTEDQVRQAVAERNRTKGNDKGDKSFIGELTRPTNIGATIGDIAGEAIGVPLALLTGGIVNPITASGALSGAGAFIGSQIEDPGDMKKALSEAGTATAISAATPAIANIARPVFRPVNRVLEGFGKQIVKTGSPVLERLFGEAKDRSIDVFAEMIERGMTKLPRAKAMKVAIKQRRVAEKVIQNSIEKAKNPIVTTRKNLSKAFDILIKDNIDEGAKQSLRNLKENILEGMSPRINAKEALKAKRKLFEISFGKNSTLHKARSDLARLINKSLKDKVNGVVKPLREQEITFYMEKIFKKLRNAEGKAPINFSINAPIQSLLRSTGEIGPRIVSAIGEGIAKLGQTSLPPIPQTTQKALRNIPQFLPQLRAPELE